MPILPPSSVQAAAGAASASRIANPAVLRTLLKKPGAIARAEDEVIVGAEAVDKSQVVRPLEDNSQENAREDHQQHAQDYDRGGKKRDDDQHHLDVAG
jgi:hypothetical protein